MGEAHVHCSDMKRLQPTLHAWLPPVVLYREDIDEIIERIRRTSKEGIQFRCGGFAFESLEEIIEQRGDELKDLTIEGRLGWFGVSIGKGQITLAAGAPDDHVAGDWHYLKNFLREKVPWYTWLLWRPMFWVFVIFFGVSVLSVFVKGSIATTPRVAGILLGAFVLMFLLSLLHYQRRPRVYLGPRHRFPSFWKRNADQISVGAIGAGIGSVLTLLVQAILAHFRQSAP
jgi:hypothetical protein